MEKKVVNENMDWVNENLKNIRWEQYFKWNIKADIDIPELSEYDKRKLKKLGNIIIKIRKEEGYYATKIGDRGRFEEEDPISLKGIRDPKNPIEKIIWNTTLLSHDLLKETLYWKNANVDTERINNYMESFSKYLNSILDQILK